MPLRLPPLSSLRLFEAAGRLGSFKLAAEELNVTPSAVSHGIVSLERTLGVQFFVRDPRKLTLTPEGADYLAYVAEALSLIAIGTDRLPGKQARRSIAVSCAPTIASRWLLPRLHKFRSRWPTIDVTIDTSRRQVGFPIDGFDFAVRMSPATVAHPAWTRLFGELLTPVCSPTYREAITASDGLVDLSRASPIHLTAASEDWRSWAERAGQGSLDLSHGIGVDTMQLAFEAAVMGLGVALGRRPLVDYDLASGALVELGLPTIVAETAYWLVCSDAANHRPDLLGFKRWLLQEAEDFRRGDGMLPGRLVVAGE